VRIGAGRRYYPLTFYPGETDIKRAGIVEVTEGAEVKDVDIKLARRAEAFAVSGKVIDADTGQPMSNLAVGYGAYNPQDKRMMGFGFGDTRTDARGRFTIEGVVPGRYAVFVMSDLATYSEPALFEVTDADVAGIEVKMRRGATISGVAQIEGAVSKSDLEKLQRLTVNAYVQSDRLSPPDNRSALIGADGSFRLTGVAPGKVLLYPSSYPPVQNLRLVRIERDGMAQPGGIEVTPGAEISNVRLIFEYGSGSIHGQVRVENGQLPEGATMFVGVVKPGEESSTRPVGLATVDSRGRFLIEGIPTGDYQIILRFRFLQPVNRRFPTARQNVSVTNGMETEVTLVLDLSEQATGGGNP
jgi:hypothetical protein